MFFSSPANSIRGQAAAGNSIMRVLFIHRTMPGQFGRLAAALAGEGHDVVFVTRTVEQEIAGVRAVSYTPTRPPARETHRYLLPAEAAVLNGQAAARQCFALH